MGNALHTHGAVTSAKEARFAQAGGFAVQGPTAVDARTGVLIAPGSLALVTGTSATAPMSVSIAPHQWYTSRGSANGPYLGALETATAVTIGAAPGAGTGTRIDVVYVKQQDATPGVPSADASTAPLYGVQAGVPGGAKPALPVGAEELATVAVAPGATSTSGANITITNTARQTGTRGGIVVARTQTEADAQTAYASLEQLVLSNQRRRWHDGTRWRFAGDYVIVANRTERDALPAYPGLRVFQSDTGQQLIRGFLPNATGPGNTLTAAWRIDGAEEYPNAQMNGTTVANSGWLGTTFSWVAGLGDKITIPADGIARRCVFEARVQIKGDGWYQQRCDTSGTSYYWPNGGGVNSSAATEDGLHLISSIVLDGTQAATFYTQARSTVAVGASFFVPVATVRVS